MQEIHIKSSIGSADALKEKELPLELPREIRKFSPQELLAFYHGSLPGMQPTPAFTEAIKALQLAEEAYISADKNFHLKLARACILFSGMLSTLERCGLVDESEMARNYGILWEKGLFYNEK